MAGAFAPAGERAWGFGPRLGDGLGWIIAAVAVMARPWAAARAGALPQPRSETGRPPPEPTPADLAAFETVALPHLPAAFSFARFLTRGDAAAEDVVQEAYLKALRAFGGFRGGDARAWILTIVRRCVVDWARSRSANDTRLDDDDEATGASLADPGDSAEQGMISRQDAAAIRRLIAELPAPLAEVILLREVEELSYKQIAEAIGAPIGTVMSRLARARAALAAAWRALPEGGGR